MVAIFLKWPLSAYVFVLMIISQSYGQVRPLQKMELLIYRDEVSKKYGVLDMYGQMILSAKYDSIFPFKEGRAMIFQGAKVGFVDSLGTEVVSAKYQGGTSFSEGLAAVVSDNKAGYIDRMGNEIISPKYDGGGHFKEGLARVMLNKKLGYIDLKGNEVIPPIYDNGANFQEGLAVIMVNNKIGYIDRAGNEIVPPKYENAGDFQKGIAVVYLGGKMGLIDKTGKELISPRFEGIYDKYRDILVVKIKMDNRMLHGYISSAGKELTPVKYTNDLGSENFRHGLARVCVDSLCGLVDKNGVEVLPIIYKTIGYFDDGRHAVVKRDGKYGTIDTLGKEIIKPLYEASFKFDKEGYASVKRNGKYGMIDRTGKEVVKPVYDYVSSFDDGYAKVSVAGKYGIVDRAAREIVSLKYEKINIIRVFDEVMFEVRNEKYKCGLVDKQGNEVMPLIFDEIKFFTGSSQAVYFAVVMNGRHALINKAWERVTPWYEEMQYYSISSGMVPVRLDGKYGFFNVRTGKEIAPKYDDTKSFMEKEFAVVSLGGERFKINENGDLLEKVKYDYIHPLKGGLRTVIASKKWGAINEKGIEIIPLQYDYLSPDDEGLGYRSVQFNDKHGLIDRTGKIVIPIIYKKSVSIRSDKPVPADFKEKGGLRVRADDKTFIIDKAGKIFEIKHP